MLSTDVLMQPRFKVIALYPNSIFKVGEVIATGRHEGVFCDPDGPKYSDFPAIFQRLQWWEDRAVEDLPEYVRHKVSGMVYKAEYLPHDLNEVKIQTTNLGLKLIPTQQFLPATLTEYEAYKTK